MASEAPTPRFDPLPRPELWRFALGAAIAAAGWFGAGVLLLPGAGDRHAELLLFLASFGGLLLGLLVAVRLLYRRGPRVLVGPGGLRFDALAAGAGAMLVLLALSNLLAVALAPPTRQLTLAGWLRHLPLALVLIALQATTEELFFRGYLMRGLAARFRSPLVWWLLPGLAFGALHWNPADYGPAAPVAVASAALFGLLLGDVTARTGSLSAAIGIHFANNAAALLVLSPPSGLDGLALLVLAPSHLWQLALLDLATTVAAWAFWLSVRPQSGASM